MGYLEIWSEIRRKKNKVYVALNPAERRLLMQGLLSFRNKVLARGIDTIDLDRIDIMKQVYNFKASDGDAPWKKKQVSISKKLITDNPNKLKRVNRQQEERRHPLSLLFFP